MIRSVKEAIGSAVKLMIDVNCGWSAEAAFRYIPVVMEWSPRWIEDPIWPPENVAGLREIKRRLNAPLATGGDISRIGVSLISFGRVLSRSYSRTFVSSAGLGRSPESR